MHSVIVKIHGMEKVPISREERLPEIVYLVAATCRRACIDLKQRRCDHRGEILSLELHFLASPLFSLHRRKTRK